MKSRAERGGRKGELEIGEAKASDVETPNNPMKTLIKDLAGEKEPRCEDRHSGSTVEAR